MPFVEESGTAGIPGHQPSAPQRRHDPSRDVRPALRLLRDWWQPFAVSFAVTCLFFIDVCAWVFACGCRSLWAGADTWCNVHAAAAPHCPFCVRGSAGYVWIMGLVLAPQLVVSAWLRRRRSLRIAVCLALFPLMMMAVGAWLGWWDGYWEAA